VNDKRIQRLWRDEGRKVPFRKRKKPHRGTGTAVGAMCPIRPNALRALDFQFDVTADGRTLELLNVVDEYTGECPAILVDHSIDADRLAIERGAPGFVRFDNGPEFIAATVADWWARPRPTAETTTPSGGPELLSQSPPDDGHGFKRHHRSSSGRLFRGNATRPPLRSGPSRNE
jgi:transposase InsO family protein